MGKKILVVDDEPKILSVVKGYLEKEGFTVITAETGEQAIALLRNEKPSLIVLDWMLPDISGLDVAREIRRQSHVPIIMLTARAEEVDKLVGLELGADDYVTKPFSLRELAARIRVVLRRSEPDDTLRPDTVTIGNLTIDFLQYHIMVNGQPVSLTPTEFKLLSVLARNPGRVFSRLQLLEAALGDAYEGYERSIDTHISNLRKKIEPDPANPVYIVTVYGLGYKIGNRAEVTHDILLSVRNVARAQARRQYLLTTPEPGGHHGRDREGLCKGSAGLQENGFGKGCYCNGDL